MGTGAEIALLGLAAGGTIAQQKAQRDLAKDQDRSAAAGIRQTAKKQSEADQRVQQEIARVGQSRPESSERRATNQFLQALGRNRGAARTAVGKTSRAFGDASTAADAGLQAQGASDAATFGAVAAPQRQREVEGRGIAGLGTDLGQIGRQISGDAFVNDLRTRSLQANPWLMALGSLAQGAGSGLAARGGASKPGVTPGGVRTDVPVLTQGGTVYG